MRKIKAICVGLVMLAFVLSGCGGRIDSVDAVQSPTPVSSTPEDAVQSYLQLLGAGKADEAVKLLVPNKYIALGDGNYGKIDGGISDISVARAIGDSESYTIDGQDAAGLIVGATYTVNQQQQSTDFRVASLNNKNYIVDPVPVLRNGNVFTGPWSECANALILPGTSNFTCKTKFGDVDVNATSDLLNVTINNIEIKNIDYDSANQLLVDPLKKWLTTNVVPACDIKSATGETTTVGCSSDGVLNYGDTDNHKAVQDVRVAVDPSIVKVEIRNNDLYVGVQSTLNAAFGTVIHFKSPSFDTYSKQQSYEKQGWVCASPFAGPYCETTKRQDATFGTADNPAWFHVTYSSNKVDVEGVKITGSNVLPDYPQRADKLLISPDKK